MTTALQTVITGLIGAFLGAAISYYFALRKDKAERRREKIVGHLVDAYLKIEDNTSRDMLDDDRREIERAFASVILFGDRETVRLAKEASQRMEAGKATDVKPLLLHLRDRLREELSLPPVEDRFFSLRFPDPDREDLAGQSPDADRLLAPATAPRGRPGPGA